MVARGDLGMEIPVEKIFLAQKSMIYKCNMQGKPVVIATQMLESMIKSPRPTRAEATNVANAVIDGTDCVMVSGKTAAGSYPIEAVETMTKICIQAEDSLNYKNLFQRVVKAADLPMSPLESLACSAVQMANSAGAALILVVSRDMRTSELVSKYMPYMIIVSVVEGERNEGRHWFVYRSVVLMVSEAPSDEDAVELAVKQAKSRQLCKTGDTLVVVLHHAGNSFISVLIT